MQILRSFDASEVQALREEGQPLWLDLKDPDGETVDAVGKLLGFHELAVEDTKEFCQRPKVDAYGDQLLMVYFGAADPDGLPVPVEVHLHIGPDFIVTVHRESCRKLDAMQGTLDADPPKSPQSLIYRVIDALTDSLLDVLEQVAADVEEHETSVFERPRAQERDRMAVLRRALGRLRRVLMIQRQVLERAVERIESIPALDEKLDTYYRDVADHLWRAVDEVEAARDTLQGLLDTYTNEVQERLTIVATIFLPLTVITGFFGMNFNWLISHIGSTAAFWGLGVGGLVLSASGIRVWLVRTGMYHGHRSKSREEAKRLESQTRGPGTV